MLSPEQIETAGDAVAAVYNDIEAKMLDHLVIALINVEELDQMTMTELNLLAQSHTQQLRDYINDEREVIAAGVRETAERLIEASDADDIKRMGKGTPLWPQQVTATVDGVARILARDNIQMVEGAKQAFLSASVEAITRVNTGTMTTERALHSAVRKLEREGIPIITYQNASTGIVTVANKVDVAVRRHIRTQIAQDGARMTLERMERGEVTLVEVSSHEDSRPSHAAWQGQVYSLHGEVEIDGHKYADFYEATRYGSVDGLLGANCRHSFGPYRHGAPRAYEQNPQHPSGLEGSEVYELEQQQRYLERRIREAKRELRGAQQVYDKTGSLESRTNLLKAQSTLKERQSAMRDLISDANAKAKPGTTVLTRRPNREWAGDMPKGTAIKASGRKVDEFLGGSGASATLKANGITKSAARAAIAKEMASRGGTAADFASLSASDQQGVLRGAIAGLRTNSPEKPRPLAASRISSDGRSQAMYSAILEAKMAGASMGEDEHLRRWKAEGVTNEQRTALYDRLNGYIKSSNSFGINRHLRGLSQDLDSASRGTADLLTKLTTRAQLEEDTTFTRFAGGTDGTGTGGYIRDVLGLTSEEFTGADAVTLDRKLVGRDITDKAFVSVSSNAGKNVFAGMDVCLIIRANKGAHVMFTDNVKESEAIFAPGTPMTITAVKALDYEKGQAKLTKMIIEVSAG